MELKNVKTAQQDGIVTVTISRDEKLNALNNSLITELHEVLQSCASDRSVAGIIITGAGRKAFMAGADIAEFKDLNAEQGKTLAKKGQDLIFDFIENMPKPVIAAINGFALGGGLELALACHVRLAADNARLGLPEVTLGLIPGYGGTQRLAQLAGKGRAMEMILSGTYISADEAYRIGIVNKVCAQEKLLDEAIALIGSFIKNSPEALASAIHAINGSFGKNGYPVEIEKFGGCLETENAYEGISAFIEKRKPEFKR